MKAQVGDFLRKDGRIVKIVGLDKGTGYFTSDGGVISDAEISLDDILLESEI